MKVYTRKSDETLLYCMELKDAGYSYIEIAKMVGLTRWYVSKQIRSVLAANAGVAA